MHRSLASGLPWMIVLLGLVACRAEDVAQDDWQTLLSASSEEEKVAAARAFAEHATPATAKTAQDALGAFVGSDAEIFVAAAVARFRPEGAAFLVRRVYEGATLDEAFADVLHPDEEDAQPSLLDWPALADALSTALPEDPVAARWMALLALADRGEVTGHVRDALAEDPVVRAMVLDGLQRADAPRLLPPALLAAFGAPPEDREIAFLARAYRVAFGAALDDREATDFETWGALTDAFGTAFPDETPPAEDAAIIAFLRNDPGGDDASDSPDFPPFADTASFLQRHHRTEWLPVVRRYAELDGLPSNALSFVCRASAAECEDVLLGASGLVDVSASDVAPALELPGGDTTLTTACDALPRSEALSLAQRGAGAGMPLEVRESAAMCLTVLGEDAHALVEAVMREAEATARDDVGERLDDTFGGKHPRKVREPEVVTTIELD